MNKFVLYSAAAFLTMFGTTCQTVDVAQEKHFAGLKKSRSVSGEQVLTRIQVPAEEFPEFSLIDSTVYTGTGIICTMAPRVESEN